MPEGKVTILSVGCRWDQTDTGDYIVVIPFTLRPGMNLVGDHSFNEHTVRSICLNGQKQTVMRDGDVMFGEVPSRGDLRFMIALKPKDVILVSTSKALPVETTS